MRKYQWLIIVVLIGCIVAFASCRRMEQMMDPLMPDAEKVEPTEPTEMPEEVVETPADTEMTTIVGPPVGEPESTEDTTVAEPMPPPAPVAVATVEPPSGSRISPDTMIDVTFDGIPADLTVSTGELSVSDANAMITGPFMAGSLTLNLVWADGIETLSYIVEEDVPPPPEGMVAIPAGDFKMGYNGITVWVDAFYMDIYEVTNLEYKRFVLANPEWEKGRVSGDMASGSYLSHWDDDGNYPEGQANHPITNVSWYAAAAYAEWVGKRLPTEAEWEKAARGGLVGKTYVLGDTSAHNRGNFGPSGTVPVGNYPQNGYGLYDMAGNVSEFCLDHYDPDFYASAPDRNPLNGAPPSNTIADLDAYIVPGSSTQISVRGSSWVHVDHGLAHRYSRVPSVGGQSFGIRCVQDVDQ